MLRITHLLRLALAAALAIGTLITLFGSPIALAAPPQWTVGDLKITELKPNIKPGGRANTIAVHPNNSTILVASESGGLFKSGDGGNTWQHVDGLPVFYTNAVAFVPSDAPSDPKIVIVSANEDFSVSNRGGIWRSENGGATWKQVLWKDVKSGQIDDGTLTPNASWPCGQRFSAYEISIAPDTGEIYVADSCGVSISSDQGKTWKHHDVFGGGFSDGRVLSILALPITTEGCKDPHGNLVAGGGNLVLAGGPSGVRRSPNGGSDWCEPKISPMVAAIGDMHAFGRSPVANQAYVAAEIALDDTAQKAYNLTCSKPGETCGYMALYLTPDGGDTWEISYIAPDDIWRPGGGGCGGIAFAKAIGNAVYVSNRCMVYSVVGGVAQPFIKWPDTSFAGDTRDLAFNSNNNQPILAATDGGLIKPPDESNSLWTFAGAFGQGNITGGYNALQLYEVIGQWIGDSHHNLYFGTQDNALWSSQDWQNNWTTWTRCCNEGGYFQGEYRVATSSDSQITFLAGQTPSRLSALPPVFTCESMYDNSKCPGVDGMTDGVSAWQPPNNRSKGIPPKIIRKDFHVQGVEEAIVQSPPAFWFRGLAVTSTLGADWKLYAAFDDNRLDLPKLSFGAVPAGPTDKAVLYQAIQTDDPAKDIHYLARIVEKPCTPDNSPSACVTYPRMETCPATNTCPVTPACSYKEKFGNFGLGPTMYSDRRIFAVDPGNVNHLIAPDIEHNNMMETWDGGDCWTRMDTLTSLVTDGSNLNFSGQIFFDGKWGATSLQASAVSFHPEQPEMVAVGTVQNGIFISADRGQNWAKLSGSERATLISSLPWRSANEIIASTYGRGLWRIEFKVGYWFKIADKDKGPVAAALPPCRSPDCFHRYVQRPPEERPSPYNEAVLAFGGAIEGARVTNGILDELFIRPGTSIAFALGSDKVPNIKITETTRSIGFVGVKGMPRRRSEAPIMAGLTLRKLGARSELVGVLFSRRPRLMYVADERDRTQERPVGQERSPSVGKPYLEVLTRPATGPGGTIPVGGRNLEIGSTIEIAIDGHTVEKVVVRQDGRFSASVQAPTRFGLYRVTIVDGASGKVLHGATVMVRPSD